MSRIAEKWVADIEVYHKHIYDNSPICRAYEGLMSVMRRLQADFRTTVTDYRVGNISPGYLDYTYFPFVNEELRAKGLRYGIVLNHRTLSFELWLMAKNHDLQLTYWPRLKDLPWNKDKAHMPQYTVLDTTIDSLPDFSDLSALTTTLITTALNEAQKINRHL